MYKVIRATSTDAGAAFIHNGLPRKESESVCLKNYQPSKNLTFRQQA